MTAGPGGPWSDWADRAERAARGFQAGGGPGPDDAHIRVSDAERTAVADRLSAHFAAGRLDQAEFDDRMSRAMAAKTRGDLPPLLADLPSLVPPSAVAQPRGPGRTLLKVALLMLILVSLAGTLSFPVAHVGFGWVPLVVLILIVARLGHRRS